MSLLIVLLAWVAAILLLPACYVGFVGLMIRRLDAIEAKARERMGER